MARRLILFVLGFAACSQAVAGPVEWRLRRLQEEKAAARDELAMSPRERAQRDVSLETLYYDQLIDHAQGERSATYRQQYHIDSSLASGADAPVLFYLCGEWDCDAGSIQRGAIRAHARELHAHLIALEHRYYGQSLPTPQFSAEELRHLTTAAALRDAATFQRYAVEHHNLRGKWIVVGASYSANLAAYYRVEYPELVVGSLASSGPVRADADFSEYDKHVSEIAGPECAAAMRRVVAEVEAALDNDPARFEAIKRQFTAEAIREPVDFLYVIADVGAAAVQYGMRDAFCDALTGAVQSGELAAYADFAQQIFDMWGEDAVGFSMQGSESLEPSEAPLRPWFWQSCTEYGYWQNAWPDAAVTTRSQRINADYHNAVCRRFFGDAIQPVDPSGLNDRFYAPLLDASFASNILFTNGSQDPWSVLSLTPAGQDGTRNPALALYMIDGAAHCDDLGTPSPADSEALRGSRTRFMELARTWLQ